MLLHFLQELKHSLEHTQRPLLAEAENAQKMLERTARDGSDEDKDRADHAKRELDEVKVSE